VGAISYTAGRASLGQTMDRSPAASAQPQPRPHFLHPLRSQAGSCKSAWPVGGNRLALSILQIAPWISGLRTPLIGVQENP